jgi:hypothetical protein
MRLKHWLRSDFKRGVAAPATAKDGGKRQGKNAEVGDIRGLPEAARNGGDSGIF